MPNYEFGSFHSIAFESKIRKLDGQDHRSGKNVNLSTLKKKSHMMWRCPKGVSFSLKRDVTGKDPVICKKIENDTITPFFDYSDLYPSDPHVPAGYPADSFLIEVMPCDAPQEWHLPD